MKVKETINHIRRIVDDIDMVVHVNTLDQVNAEGAISVVLIEVTFDDVGNYEPLFKAELYFPSLKNIADYTQIYEKCVAIHNEFRKSDFFELSKLTLQNEDNFLTAIFYLKGV